MAVKFLIGSAAAPRPAARPVYTPPVEVTVGVQPYKDGIRLVALDANGKRLPNGNLLKIFPNGNVYLYHTINPALGMELDREGRLKVTYTNPHSSQ